MNIPLQTIQQTVAQRLGILNMFNVAFGGILRRHPKPIIQGIAEQNIAWGLINCGIAGFGWIGARRGTQAGKPENIRRLRLILWFNAGLDCLYMLGGAGLVVRSHQKHQRRPIGTGIGIIMQGGLLFVFDVFHAVRIRG